MARINWSREELLVAFALYCKIPFARIVASNPQIIDTAKLLGRSADALSMKLSNFARLDPALQKRGIRGLSHGGKGEVELWLEFGLNTERLAFESELALRKLVAPAELETIALPDGPTDREGLVRIRLVQSFFRQSVLSSYAYSCSFCGLKIREMLVASHIIPWKTNIDRRADPRNGICLCSFHDRAFDRGILAVSADLEIIVSERVSNMSSNGMARVALIELSGHPIRSADRFQADETALSYHRVNIFK
jgi:hypothetical protein